jgi:hypothetical protein
MGQQSNKVQKRKRRLDYHKRKKLASKTSAATAKPVAATKTASAAPAKKAEKPAAKPAEKPDAVASQA